MEFVLIFSGIWNIIFAHVKWSLQAKNRLLKILCIINGTYLITIGGISSFISLNDKSTFAAFLLSMLLVGMLIDFKFNTEKNVISKLAIFSSFFLIAGAIGMMIFAENIEDIIDATAILSGCVMILSTPFTQLSEVAKNNKGK